MPELFKTVTIYENPSDYPGLYVARLWTVMGGKLVSGAVLKTSTKIEDCRQAAIDIGCDWMLARDPSDEPQIVESWI